MRGIELAAAPVPLLASAWQAIKLEDWNSSILIGIGVGLWLAHLVIKEIGVYALLRKKWLNGSVEQRSGDPEILKHLQENRNRSEQAVRLIEDIQPLIEETRRDVIQLKADHEPELGELSRFSGVGVSEKVWYNRTVVIILKELSQATGDLVVKITEFVDSTDRQTQAILARVETNERLHRDLIAQGKAVEKALQDLAQSKAS